MSKPAPKSVTRKFVIFRFPFLSSILLLAISAGWYGCTQSQSTTGPTSAAGKNTTSGRGWRDDERFSAAAQSTAEERRRQIRSEVQALGNHPWAGEYYEGDGLGMNISLLIAPRAGYVYEWRSCTGVDERNYGAVTFKDGRLRLSFTFDNKHERHTNIPEEFVPVPWGARKYLIPSERMRYFCNRVNDGTEPRRERWGLFLMRREDEKKEVEGLPDLPAEYQRLLLRKPIETEIIGVTSSTTRVERTNRDYHVKIRGGKEAGLTPGISFYVTEPIDAANEPLDIRKVGDGFSEGIMPVCEQNPGAKPKAPAVGWKFEGYMHVREGNGAGHGKRINTEAVAVDSVITQQILSTTSMVRVRGGRDIGLRPGMQLYLVDRPPSYFGGIMINTVGDKSSEGVIMTTGAAGTPGPQAGGKLSSRPHPER